MFVTQLLCPILIFCIIFVTAFYVILNNLEVLKFMVDGKITAEQAFFKLIRLAIGTSEDKHLALDADTWAQVFELSQKQALTAIVLDGVSSLSATDKPPVSLLLRWIGLVQKIEIKNKRLNKLVVMVSDKFHQEKMSGVLLKGQGLAALYANPLHRMPGDIDMWMAGDRASLVDYVRQRCPGVEVVYHHIDFPVLKETEIELHFTPSWMNNWFVNKRLQELFTEWLPLQEAHKVALPGTEGTVAVPTPEMNRVYVLLHIYRHLFDEGIGLRQLLDYYHVLLQPCTAKEREDTCRILCQLKMKRFASAVMYVEREVFGLPETAMLVKPSPSYGRKLLSEVMRAGNFGKYDDRINRKENETSWQKFWRKVTRNFTFLMDYPSEVVWSPVFKIWHYFWRYRNGYFEKKD